MVSINQPTLPEALNGIENDPFFSNKDKNVGKALAVLLAVGVDEDTIGKVLGLDSIQISVVKEYSYVVETSLAVQIALGFTAEQRIASAVNQAIAEKIKLLSATEDDKLRNQICNDILDRHFGKPTQTVQSIGVQVSANTSMKELDSKFEAMQKRLGMLETKRQALMNSKQVINVTPK